MYEVPIKDGPWLGLDLFSSIDKVIIIFVLWLITNK